MKRNMKRLLAFVFALVMIFCTASVAFAEETPNESVNRSGKLVEFEVTSDGMNGLGSAGKDPTRSSISGYGQGYVDNTSWLVVPVTSSGVGGMGITVKTSSSWNGYMSLTIVDAFNTVFVQNYAIYSNDEVEFHNLTNNYPIRFYFIFDGIPDGQSIYVQAWIYG